MRRFIDLELRRIVWRLHPFDIVLINTRAGGRYGADNYVQSGYGMGRDATLYLLERGVRVTGTECVELGCARSIYEGACQACVGLTPEQTRPIMYENGMRFIGLPL